MREYAIAKTGALLNSAAEAIEHASHTPDEDAVHKMRVSIRRLQQAIRLFKQYLEEDGVTHVKHRLRAIMEVAGELRNRDIAMALVTKAGGDDTELAAQRLAYQKQLETVLKRYAKTHLAQAWREKLGLESAA